MKIGFIGLGNVGGKTCRQSIEKQLQIDCL